MARPFSVGAKLALRYAAAMAVTTTLFGGFVYQQVARRINREASLLVEVQLRDLVDSYESQVSEHPPDHVLRWMQEHVDVSIAHAEPGLGLGVELLAPDGRSLVAGGSLAGAGLPLSQGLLDGGGEEGVRAVNLGGRYAHLSATAPVSGGFVRVALDTTRYAENIASVRRIFAVSLPLVLVLTAAAGWYLAAQSLRPIAAINATARRLGGSNLRESLPVDGTGDELDELAVTLNDMLSRIRAGIDRMQRFNANAAHQLRTPLAAIRSEVEVTLERPRTPDEYRSALSDALRSIQQMSGAVDAMLQLARSETGLSEEQRRPVDVAVLLEEVAEFFAPLALERKIDLACGPNESAIVLGERSWLHQLFANLVSNAIDYAHAGCSVQISSSVRGRSVEVRVADTGPGIDDERGEALFERFARGENERAGGFGLGLPIAREIARAHGGGIALESRPGRGATFRVSLPLAPRGSGGEAPG